jgi:hypothetical protein
VPIVPAVPVVPPRPPAALPAVPPSCPAAPAPPSRFNMSLSAHPKNASNAIGAHQRSAQGMTRVAVLMGTI